MHTILIAGCGNIGALYDLENTQILTHAKAFASRTDFSIIFYDINYELAKKIADRYQSIALQSINDFDFTSLDCLSICTPTAAHAELLSRAFQSKIPLVICEKPVSENSEDLLNLLHQYNESSTKVLVNYIRRFQPAFQKLKLWVEEISGEENLTNISIRYQRGFINNCSHAFDIIEFLTNSEIRLESILSGEKVYDHFEKDPTLSLLANWGNIQVVINGLSNVHFTFFEIDFYFRYYKISIRDAGNIIEVYKAQESDRFFKKLEIVQHLVQYNCLNNYMIPVANRVSDFLKGKEIKDNFEQAVHLNLSMLNILKQTNGTVSN